jgi:hypothetical protein
MQLLAGEFFGGARRSSSSHGIEVSHRLAEGPPEAVTNYRLAGAGVLTDRLLTEYILPGLREAP